MSAGTRHTIRTTSTARQSVQRRRLGQRQLTDHDVYVVASSSRHDTGFSNSTGKTTLLSTSSPTCMGAGSGSTQTSAPSTAAKSVCDAGTPVPSWTAMALSTHVCHRHHDRHSNTRCHRCKLNVYTSDGQTRCVHECAITTGLGLLGRPARLEHWSGRVRLRRHAGGCL